MPRDGEQGFALMTTVWLLTLAAAIAALLMLHALREARTVAAAQREANGEEDIDDILAQISASALFEGPGSIWGRVPTRGQLALVQGTADVSIEREVMHPDVNRAAAAGIDGLLHDHGIAGDQRAAILARIADARAGRRLIGTFADLRALGRGILPPARETCLAAYLSPFSGAQAEAGAPSTDLMGPSPVRAGDTLRVTIGAGARQRVAVLRITGTATEPYSVLDWYEGTCPAAAA